MIKQIACFACLLFIPLLSVTQSVSAQEEQQSYVRLSQPEYQLLLSHAQQNGESLPRQSGIPDNGPEGEPMVRLTNREYTRLIEQSKPASHENWIDKLPPFSKFSFWLGWVSGVIGIIIARLLAVYVFRR